VVLAISFLINFALAGTASGLKNCPIPELKTSDPYYEYLEKQTDTKPVNAADDLSLNDLNRLIKDKNIKSIDELVPHLKNNRRMWTGMYHSESAQEKNATCKTPRIISFGYSGKLMLGWVACKDKEDEKPYPDCEILEAMENVNGDSKVVEYSLPGNKHKHLERKPPQANQKHCLHCHGPAASPIFESYNAWPGAFGSSSRNHVDVIQEGSNEEKCYKEFTDYVKSTKAPPRFSELEFHHTRVVKEREASFHGRGVVHSAVADPNGHLTKVIGNHTTTAFLKEILRHPDFEAFKYAFYALALRTAQPTCLGDDVNDFETFFPPEVRMGEKPYHEMYLQVKQTYSKEFKQVSSNVRENNPVAAPDYAPQDFMKIRQPEKNPYMPWKYLLRQSVIFGADFDYLLKQMNLRLSRPNLSITQKYNRTTGGRGIPADMSDTFIEMVKKCDTDLYKISEKGDICEKLAEKSREAISAYLKKKKKSAPKPSSVR
jgi:hypothetical protein